MKAVVRRKLEMGASVRVFNRAHPSADVSYTAVVAHFEEEVARGEALAAQQEDGLIAEREAVKLQVELRGTLQGDMLRHLVTVGEEAAKENTDLRGKFRLPDTNATSLAFRTAARAMVTVAQAQADLLGRHGMGAAFLGDLTETVTKLEGANNAARAGRLAHVGAGADLDAVAGGISSLAMVLDGIHRYQYRNDPELQAAWDSARNVFGPVRTKAAVAPVGGGTVST